MVGGLEVWEWWAAAGVFGENIDVWVGACWFAGDHVFVAVVEFFGVWPVFVGVAAGEEGCEFAAD